MTDDEKPIDIEALLSRIQPPRLPDESAASTPKLLAEISGWSRTCATNILAGLLTDPGLHANDIRLEWLQRLVISKSSGKRKPTPPQLSDVLNRYLVDARVERLEDPIEDVFCDLINTREGDYRIILGRWEAAAPYTQTVYDAFASLPDGELKESALQAVHALLRLSDALAERASLSREVDSSGEPMGEIRLPSKERLKQLARRVRFRTDALRKLGIDPDQLSSFILKDGHFAFVSDRDAGDTPLEFHPLLRDGEWITVAAPSNISVAVRSVLIGAAVFGGIEKTLQWRLLEQQGSYSEATGFWPVPHIELSPPNKYGMRASVCSFDHGRFLHIVQLPVMFDGFPAGGFARVRRLSDEANRFLGEDIERFWRFAEQQADCRWSATVLLLSGWGCPHAVAPPIDEAKVPGHWQFLALSFADAAILGACDDGKFRDIFRMLQQQEMLEKQGFSMTNPNGLLNLFGFWKGTKGNLIPEHMWEMKPPCNVVIDVGEILRPRHEGIRRQDKRALPLPEGGYKVVQRKDWGEDGIRPIYANVQDLSEARLNGAITLAGRTWWIETKARDGEERSWRYQIWNAVVEWLAAIAPKVLRDHPTLFLPGAYKVRIDLPDDAQFHAGAIDGTQPNSVPLSETVTLIADEAVLRTGSVVATVDWPGYLRSPKNIAEVELVAAVLEAFADKGKSSVTRTRLIDIVRSSIESEDWRWLHAQEPITPLQRLARHGLIDDFRRIPFSAHALTKCGSVWGFRDRERGSEIDGEDGCREFLKEYRDHMLALLIADIRRFDRRTLIEVAARRFQSGRHEQYRWRSTIRALRSIRGSGADEDAFARQNEINAVQRAAKGVAEIAACEAAQSGGLIPNRVEVDEVFATALLLSANGQLFAAIRGGLIPPKIRVSPAGDVLCEREVFSKLLEPGATWVHSRALNEADKRYGKRDKPDDEAPTERLGWSAELRAAVEGEYDASAEAFVDLQYALIQMAEKRGKGVFFACHSEVLDELRKNTAYNHGNVAGMLKRLTLRCRPSWDAELSEADLDLSKFDRRFSLINRPLLAIDANDDPTVLIAPAFVSDAIMYAISGLHDGELQGTYWDSGVARSHAGARAKASGEKFEKSVEDRLNELGLNARMRCSLSALLNEKVDPQFGDIDIFAIGEDKRTAWVIEAKNLRLCRSETEVAARLSEYRGRMVKDSKGREKPDKLLRHIRRIQYLRDRLPALAKNLKLDRLQAVKGLLVVDAPQPMNFHMLDQLADADSAFLDAIDKFEFDHAP